MRIRIAIMFTLLAISVLSLESAVRIADADPIGEIVAIRSMAFSGDNIATAVRANLEYSMPHIESGASSVSLMLLVPQNSEQFSQEVYLGIGYSKTDESDPKLWTLCGNCGSGRTVQKVHGAIDDYSTPVRIVINKYQQGGQNKFDVLWFRGTELLREENNVVLHRGATSIEVGGGIEGDDENDMGVAGITGIRFNGAYEPCGGMGEPSCLTGSWVPFDEGDEGGKILHAPRYITTYWPESGFPVGGNLQILTTCHLTGTCEYP